MYRNKVYLGLGGNIGDSADVIERTCHAIRSQRGIYEFNVSHLYVTSPVSEIPQDDFVNCVCAFETDQSIPELGSQLHAIENAMGKVVIQKNAPRVIDIDILFFGKEYYCQKGMQVPHPRWHERLFVLIPLSDLTDTVHVPIVSDEQTYMCLEVNVHELIKQVSYQQPEQQCVKSLSKISL